ncbi:hypothetical protein [Cyclobacterium xiamenense]|uniref:hypothetical protein n=1 Tax=Cyclobacterium xiamenense TaxID=1297121 RepID=UPI0012B9D945|nr:hypothetical protein [Cyclobacterium xiamenense]
MISALFNNSITDFFYDENLIVHDGNKGINFILDEDLTILKQQKLNFKANSFYSFENKWVIFNNYLQRDWGNDLLVIDKDDFSVSSAYIPVNSDDYGFHYDARYALNVDNSGNQLYFSKAFNDTIYTLNKDFLLDKKFLIDFKDKRVSKNYLQSGINAMDLLSDMRNGNFYFIKGEMHFTSDNKLLIKILKEGKYENLLIDDIENSGEVFPVFVDDFQSNQSFYDVLYSDKEQLIFGESSEHLYQSQNLDPSFKEKYTIKSEDNFILFVLDK